MLLSSAEMKWMGMGRVRGSALEALHHVPAVDAGKTYVQDDGAGAVVVGEMQAGFPVSGQQGLEARFAGLVAQDAGEMRIVLDDQDDLVVRSQSLPVVLDSSGLEAPGAAGVGGGGETR